MRREPPLDAPSTLYHVMVREIERTAILRDDRDRADMECEGKDPGPGRYIVSPESKAFRQATRRGSSLVWTMSHSTLVLTAKY